MLHFTFDAKKLSADLSKLLKRKIVGATTDPKVHNRLLEKYYTIAIRNWPKDTGALKGIGTGYSSKGSHRYERIPHVTISSHHGIEIDPIEIRTNKIVHYAIPALAMAYGVPADRESVARAVTEDVENGPYWQDFVVYAKRYLTESMNEH